MQFRIFFFVCVVVTLQKESCFFISHIIFAGSTFAAICSFWICQPIDEIQVVCDDVMFVQHTRLVINRLFVRNWLTHFTWTHGFFSASFDAFHIDSIAFFPFIFNNALFFELKNIRVDDNVKRIDFEAHSLLNKHQLEIAFEWLIWRDSSAGEILQHFLKMMNSGAS